MFADTPAVRLCYELLGAGPRLLVVPGTGADLRRRPRLYDGALADACTVLAFDQRGCGRSGAPDGDWSVADHADDAAALLDAVGWDDVAVLGVSFGGMVAQELALRHPDRVRRLVLAATSSGGAGGSSYPLHELAALDPAERRERVVRLLDGRGLPAEAAAAAHAWADGLAVAEDPRQLAARMRHDTWERLPALAMPVLVCGGRHDGIAPPANQQALAGRIPGARLELFDGGHLFLRQDPAALAAVVRFVTGA